MRAAIFFDGDQTLWDFQGLMRRTLAATLEELRRLRPGEVTEAVGVEDLVRDRGVVADRLRGTVTNLEAVRLEAFRHSLRRLGLGDDDLAEHLNAYYLARRFAEVDLYDDVVPALTRLGRDHHVGLLSNGNSYPDRVGLDGLFATVVFSQDHGVEKPDRRLFDLAAARVPTGVEQLVMVGDSLVNDVGGAQGAGWLGVWLNREGDPRPPDHRPDAEVRTLNALGDVIAALVG
ncbi:HAD family hydrolase [Oryzihumus leptocrescens]|uniref:Putative hydrolase of the HAD superfamily n=1 Tax=Oryzihumus leptocrescens TaxID=297536 RepID=A0A542Z7W0_9MICO|nr:HAD family hydrolase [Oryzihumus leptocrescens]TQL56425.1 putative hydrolase of the HAD superfamily [Oryzihumus leptocrescens]